MNDINVIRNHKNNKAKVVHRAEVIQASLKALFVGKKVHLFTSLCSIKGTCVDIVQNDFCLTDATYEVSSSQSDVTSKGTSSYMMVPKSGRVISILED